MLKRKINIILFLIFGFILVNVSIAQIKPLNKEKDIRNHWGLSVIYAEKGFGLSTGYYKQLGYNTDFFTNISVSGVSDTREFERFDIYGNSITIGKENRIFLIPLNIGIQQYLFKDKIESNFRPVVSVGLTPSLIITTPYEKSFFNAFGYAHSFFAMGGFAGVGMEYKEANDVALSISLRYFYLPVIGKSVNSLIDKPINDVGGLEINFGVNFLRELFQHLFKCFFVENYYAEFFSFF